MSMSHLLAVLGIFFTSLSLADEPKKVQPPSGRLIFQPLFFWLGAEHSYQGTGFFAQTPKGEIVAITSSHFLDFKGPPLVGAVWSDVTDGTAVAAFAHSLGDPGKGPKDKLRSIDLREDYLIMPAEGIDATSILKLDQRKAVKKDERVWLPNKDDKAKHGHELVEGKIVEVTDKHLIVELDTKITVQSQSGSPFISQATGEIVGTFSSYRTRGGKQQVLLTPASSLLSAISNAKSTPPLRKVVGKAATTDDGPIFEEQPKPTR